jgi:hypothetical protein
VQQYIAASGGEWALNKVASMYAMGKVKMTASELNSNDADGTGHRGGKKGGKGSAAEFGGFVLWQKKPELWCLELVVSGCKISAGSDGKVAWRQTPWHQSHASRGPPRPLRRSLQVRNYTRVNSRQLCPVDTAPTLYFCLCFLEKRHFCLCWLIVSIYLL